MNHSSNYNSFMFRSTTTGGAQSGNTSLLPPDVTTSSTTTHHHPYSRREKKLSELKAEHEKVLQQHHQIRMGVNDRSSLAQSHKQHQNSNPSNQQPKLINNFVDQDPTNSSSTMVSGSRSISRYRNLTDPSSALMTFDQARSNVSNGNSTHSPHLKAQTQMTNKSKSKTTLIEQRARDLMAQIEQKVRRDLNIPQLSPDKPLPAKGSQYHVYPIDSDIMEELNEKQSIDLNNLEEKERELQQELLQIDHLLLTSRRTPQQRAPHLSISNQPEPSRTQKQPEDDTTENNRSRPHKTESLHSVASNQLEQSRIRKRDTLTKHSLQHSTHRDQKSLISNTTNQRPLSAQRSRAHLSSSVIMNRATSVNRSRSSSASKVRASSDNWYFVNNRAEKTMTIEVNKAIDKLQRQLQPKLLHNKGDTPKTEKPIVKSVSVQLKHLLIQDEELKRVRREIEALNNGSTKVSENSYFFQ